MQAAEKLEQPPRPRVKEPQVIEPRIKESQVVEPQINEPQIREPESDASRENAALPWWQQPPFSGSEQLVPRSPESGSADSIKIDSAGSEAANRESTGVDAAGLRSSGFPREVRAPENIAAQTFMSVLSALAAPEPMRGNAADDAETAAAALPAWAATRADQEVADEADSLSYEGALRRGAPISFSCASRAQSAVRHRGAISFDSPGETVFAPADSHAAASEAAKRLASINVRLSRAECAQLKQRAAEAGLTLSAYVRSCVFEAEALRAQVKQALAELRSAAPGEKPPVSEASHSMHALRETTDARRHWWQLRPSAKNLSAQA